VVWKGHQDRGHPSGDHSGTGPSLEPRTLVGTDPARPLASSCRLRSSVSPVPKCEGPGAPSLWSGNGTRTGATRQVQQNKAAAKNGPGLKAKIYEVLFQGHECPCSLRKCEPHLPVSSPVGRRSRWTTYIKPRAYCRSWSAGGELTRSSLHHKWARTACRYTPKRGITVLAPLRFIWNATRGHRLTPWRSEYLRWRVETYSGQRAETLTTGKVLSFVWNSRWELLSFLAWTGRLDGEVRKRV